MYDKSNERSPMLDTIELDAARAQQATIPLTRQMRKRAQHIAKKTRQALKLACKHPKAQSIPARETDDGPILRFCRGCHRFLGPWKGDLPGQDTAEHTRLAETAEHTR